MRTRFTITDIHCHILPGVDDGASDSYMTGAMLRKAYREGVRKIIVTPHFRGGIFETPAEIIQRRFYKTREYARGIGREGIKLYLGCEYYRETDMVKKLKSGIRPTLGGGAYVLVEFSTLDSYHRIRNVIYDLLTAGYLPVIAHVERYNVFMSDLTRVSDVINMGAYVQANADSVLGSNGRKVKKICRTLMDRDEVHFIASDAHDMSERVSRIGKCAAYVEEKWGTEAAVRIFQENPEEILRNTI